MRLDARGHLATANAVLVSNVTEAKEGGVAGALKGLFGGKKDKADAEEYGAEEVEIKGEKVALRFREKHLGIKPLTGEEKRTTMAR
jgi:hypoxia up-regulated 1